MGVSNQTNVQFAMSVLVETIMQDVRKNSGDLTDALRLAGEMSVDLIDAVVREWGKRR